MEKDKRIPWLDWLRVIACFMVMVVHSTEPFYLGGEGSLIASESNMWWVAFFDSFVRYCVPLFVVASGYLLLPLHDTTGEFFRKRAVKILIPFIVWSVFYALYWGEPVDNLENLLLNFNYAAGHLWFVYMILGLYLIMPLLSPWAEKVSKKELTICLAIWLFTTFIPLIRNWVDDGAFLVTHGPTGIPRQALFPLWGEASWNGYGLFYYLSGFVGYMLIGLWLRKFGSELSAKRSWLIAIPSFLAGFAICFGGFVKRVLESSRGAFPVEGPVDIAVLWETTWCNDTIGVALMTIGTVLMIRNIRCQGELYHRIIAPISKVSYGIYLGHMVALAFYSQLFRGLMTCTPLIILTTAASTFVTVSIIAVLVRKIPVVGKYIIG